MLKLFINSWFSQGCRVCIRLQLNAIGIKSFIESDIGCTLNCYVDLYGLLPKPRFISRDLARTCSWYKDLKKLSRLSWMEGGGT